MIIIKNIILYFIQIRHTDDFPSTGTRLVMIITCSSSCVPVLLLLLLPIVVQGSVQRRIVAHWRSGQEE